jgi:RHS repeat-associated protein
MPTHDAENRLTTIAPFTGVYPECNRRDGDGHQVKSVVSGVTTAFITSTMLSTSGTHFAWTGSTSTMTKSYYAGTQRLAMRTGSRANTNLKLVLSFIKVWRVGDHASIKLSTSLGSTSVTADYAGTLISRTLYKPWGEIRYQSGALPMQYTFTGQYSHTADFGLMFYVARWYDPVLGRMTQPDTIIPGAGNPIAWDRYAYAMNSPVVYNDPTGHCPWCISALVGAVIGAGVSIVTQVVPDKATGNEVSIDWKDVAVSTVSGAVFGAVFAPLAPVANAAALTTVGGAAAFVAQSTVAGAVAGAVSGQAEAVAGAVYDGVVTGDNTNILQESLNNGLGDLNEIASDAISGGITSGVVSMVGGTVAVEHYYKYGNPMNTIDFTISDGVANLTKITTVNGRTATTVFGQIFFNRGLDVIQTYTQRKMEEEMDPQ